MLSNQYFAYSHNEAMFIARPSRRAARGHRSPFRWLSRLSRAVALYWAERRAAEALASMDAHLLRDIGLDPWNLPPGLRSARRAIRDDLT